MNTRAVALLLAGLGGCYHPPADLRPDAPATGSGRLEGGPAPSEPAARGCDAALAVLLERSPLLRAARGGAAVTRADVASAGAWEAPEIRAGDNLRDLGRESEIALRIRWPGPGVGGAEVSAAEARGALSAAEVQALEVEVARDARLAHAEWRRATHRARLARAAAADATRRAELLAQRLKAGTATAVAHAAARLEASAAEEAARADERRADRLARAWAARTGAAPAAGDRCAPPMPRETDSDVPHPAVAAARAQAWEADAIAFAERRSQWIWPTYVQLGWVEDSAGGQRQDRIQLQFGLALPLPGADTGDRATAEAEHKREVAEATIEATRSAVEAARAAYEAAVADRAALEARQPDLDAAAALLSRGEAAGASPDELSGLARRIRDAQQAVAEAEYDVDVAAAELAAALGMARAR